MFENLSNEVLEKVKQAKSREEALELLKQNGITLSDEDLANAAGGEGGQIDGCPAYEICMAYGVCPTIATCPVNITPQEPGRFCNTHCWFRGKP